MDLVDTNQRAGTKVSELEQVAYECEKFELIVTFEQKVGELLTFKIIGRGPNSNFQSERIGYKGQELHGDLIRSMNHLLERADGRSNITAVKALTVKLTKGKMAPKQLRGLAIAAWAEAVGLPLPSEEEVSKDVQTAKDKQNEMRTALIEDLRGGPAGVERFNGRSKANTLAAKDLKDIDVSGADLSGLNLRYCGVTQFNNSNFEGSNLTGAKGSGCDFGSCNFKNAIMDGVEMHATSFAESSFVNSSLVNAVFRGANLQNVDFESANLKGADLTFASIKGANLSTANLTDVIYSGTEYDAQTRWPKDYAPPSDPNASNPHAIQQLVFSGSGRDPFLMQQVKAMASETGGSLGFDAFVSRLEKEFDQERLKKSLKMLKAERFQLFAEVANDSLVGVVKSQTDPDLVYSCRLMENGSYACCTQNLNPCGGLRGALCKHLLVLLIGITKAGELDAGLACEWVLGSKRFKSASLDKDFMTATLLRYKGAEAGEIDWRPTETMPEDYYAF